MNAHTFASHTSRTCRGQVAHHPRARGPSPPFSGPSSSNVGDATHRTGAQADEAPVRVGLVGVDRLLGGKGQEGLAVGGEVSSEELEEKQTELEEQGERRRVQGEARDEGEGGRGAQGASRADCRWSSTRLDGNEAKADPRSLSHHKLKRNKAKKVWE